MYFFNLIFEKLLSKKNQESWGSIDDKNIKNYNGIVVAKIIIDN